MRARVRKLGCVLWLAAIAACAGPPSGAGGPSSLPAHDDAGTPAQVTPPTDPPVTTDPGPSAPPDAGVPPPSVGGHPSVPTTTVPDENLKTGSGDWHLSQSSQGTGAFSDATSYAPGDTVSIHAAAPAETDAQWDLFRTGYYGGAGGRRVLSGLAHLPKATDPSMDPQTGAVHVDWPVAFQFTVPLDAASGVYLVKITAGNAQTYAIFVVREPKPRASVLVPIAVNTYQAYNDWGGTSLYGNTRKDWSAWHAFAVSFDRPYLRGDGAGNFFLNGDRDFVTFIESQGYDLAYVTDTDLDRDPSLLQGRKMIAVPGHTEYWTLAMRDGFDSALAAGTNVAFFGANDAYWQVRYDLTKSPDRRVLVGYKEYWQRDPALQNDPAHVTSMWRDPHTLNRPEALMMGVQFADWLMTSTPLYVTDAASWVWSGTGVSPGDPIPGVYGDETDHEFAGEGDNDDDEVAEGMVEGHSGGLDLAQTVIYARPGAGRVFSAATLQWCRALARAGAWDARIQQATANVFASFAGLDSLPATVKPIALPPGAPPPIYEPGGFVRTVARGLEKPAAIAMRSSSEAIVVAGNEVLSVSDRGTVTVLAGDDAPGNVDGPALSARFNAPRGVAVDPDGGTIYVADTGNHAIRVLSPDGGVSTLAGGAQGYAEGKGSAARFDTPEGLALLPDGGVAVADMWNDRIRSVSRDGTVTTLAGNGQAAAVDGSASSASFYYPFALASRPDGTLFVVESETSMVRQISPSGDVSTVAGTLGRAGWADGPIDRASVAETVGVCASPSRLFLFDGASARVREVTGGQVLTLAGGGHGGDGPSNLTRFEYVRGGAVAPDGSLWVVDTRRGEVRRITLP